MLHCFETDALRPTPHPPRAQRPRSPFPHWGRQENAPEASPRFRRAGACSRHIKTMLHSSRTDSRGRLSLQIYVQYPLVRATSEPQKLASLIFGNPHLGTPKTRFAHFREPSPVLARIKTLFLDTLHALHLSPITRFFRKRN